MNRFFKNFFPLLITTTALFFLISCKGGPKLEEVETRLKALQEKGIPDSVIASVKIAVYNVTTGKKTSNSNLIRIYSDSMAIGIEKAEKWYADAMIQNKPYLESLKKTLLEKKSNLTGLHLKTADSLMNICDSFIKIDWLVQAKVKMDKLDSIMPVLLENEIKASKTRTLVLGKWIDAHILQAEDSPYRAKSFRSYTFKKDGRFESSEAMLGQTTPFMKEDWQFDSKGEYDFKGDTIVLSITSEKCPRQVFTQLNVKENKWNKNVKPTYDSTFTIPKIEMITYQTLKEDFKKR